MLHRPGTSEPRELSNPKLDHSSYYSVHANEIHLISRTTHLRNSKISGTRDSGTSTFQSVNLTRDVKGFRVHERSERRVRISKCSERLTDMFEDL